MARRAADPLQRGGRPVVTPARESPVEIVRAALLEAIERGDYRPGDPLPSERVLGEQFRASRVSVREAIVGLVAVGLITVRHGRGAVVAERIGELAMRPFGVWLQVHRTEVVESLKLRSALDGLAAAEVATIHGLPDEVETAHHAFVIAVRSPDRPADAVLMRLDAEFHQSIADAARLVVVRELLGDLNAHSVNSHRVSMALPGQAQRSAHQHTDIVDALRARDPERARAAAAAHVDTTLDALLAHLDPTDPARPDRES